MHQRRINSRVILACVVFQSQVKDKSPVIEIKRAVCSLFHMVELAPKKRRRLDSTTPSYASARYPPSCLLSNLIHRQAPHQLSSSIQSVVVTTPPKPATPALYTFTGDHYALDLVSKSTTLLNKSPIRLAEQFHDQGLITHLVWNQRGTTLASADENGNIALWELGVCFYNRGCVCFGCSVN